MESKDVPVRKRYPLLNRVYYHYKGGVYEVLFLAKHSVNDETLVVYRSLLFGSYHTRPLSEWNDNVPVKESDSDEVSYVPRFELVR